MMASSSFGTYPVQQTPRIKSQKMVCYALEQLQLCSLQDARSKGRELQTEMDEYTAILNQHIATYCNAQGPHGGREIIRFRQEVADADYEISSILIESVTEIYDSCDRILHESRMVPTGQRSAATNIRIDLAAQDIAQLRSLRNWLASKSGKCLPRITVPAAAHADPTVVQGLATGNFAPPHVDLTSTADSSGYSMRVACSTSAAAPDVLLPSNTATLKQSRYSVLVHPHRVAQEIIRASGKYLTLPPLNLPLSGILSTGAVGQHRRRMRRTPVVPTAQKQAELLVDAVGWWKAKNEMEGKAVAKEKNEKSEKRGEWEDEEMSG